jgi:hypothetical protein
MEKIIKFLVFILIIWVIFCSCSKADYSYLNTDRRDLHKYQAYIDHYSKDTTVMGVRMLVGQWILPQDKCGGMDTIPPQWFLNCATDSIEHWYYKVDGVGYETKLRPSRIDTIWVNYEK